MITLISWPSYSLDYHPIELGPSKSTTNTPLRGLARMVKYWKTKFQKCERLLKELISSKQKSMYTQAPKRGGKHKHLIEEHYRFSVSGGYRAAIKKAASNTSQPGLLLNLDLNKTRQTISNWSSKLATNIRYQYRAWQTEQSDYISSSFEALRANAASLSSKVWSWRRTSIRADATNLPACQSFKGHVVEVDTKYAHIPSHILEQFVDLETFPPEPEPAAACVFSDIQQLPESTGANETLQMLEKTSGTCRWPNLEVPRARHNCYWESAHRISP